MNPRTFSILAGAGAVIAATGCTPLSGETLVASSGGAPSSSNNAQRQLAVDENVKEVDFEALDIDTSTLRKFEPAAKNGNAPPGLYVDEWGNVIECARERRTGTRFVTTICRTRASKEEMEAQKRRSFDGVEGRGPTFSN